MTHICIYLFFFISWCHWGSGPLAFEGRSTNLRSGTHEPSSPGLLLLLRSCFSPASSASRARPHYSHSTQSHSKNLPCSNEGNIQTRVRLDRTSARMHGCVFICRSSQHASSTAVYVYEVRFPTPANLGHARKHRGFMDGPLPSWGPSLLFLVCWVILSWKLGFAECFFLHPLRWSCIFFSLHPINILYWIDSCFLLGEGGFYFADDPHSSHPLACGQRWREGFIMASGQLLTPGGPRCLAAWDQWQPPLVTKVYHLFLFLHVPVSLPNHCWLGHSSQFHFQACSYYFKSLIFIRVQDNLSEDTTFELRPEWWKGALNGKRVPATAIWLRALF